MPAASSPSSAAAPLVVAVVGPTAAGKTALSVELAHRLDGEIINTDAMQVYRGMDIGTAKATPSERRGIVHHLLDLMEIDQVASVAEFQALARSTIAEVHKRGRVPILVGGSALYTRAVLDRFEFPGTDPRVRSRLEAEADELGSGALHRRLAERDPVAAQGILPSNGRRVVRALEVIELTGRPYSATLPRLEYEVAGAAQVGVEIDRLTLDTRIRARVEKMFAAGFVDEVRALADRGLARARTASRAIGYPEVLAHLAGELTEAEAIERTVIATRRFARRQDQWFRKDPRICWFPWDAADLPDRVVAHLAAP